jgi:hypothetical protein
MKLQFDVINAAVDLFAGKPAGKSTNNFSCKGNFFLNLFSLHACPRDERRVTSRGSQLPSYTSRLRAEQRLFLFIFFGLGLGYNRFRAFKFGYLVCLLLRR